MGRRPGPLDAVVARIKCPYCGHDQTAECWSPIDNEHLAECTAAVCRRSFVVRFLVTVETLLSRVEGEDDIEYATNAIGHRVVQIDEPEDSDTREATG